ncbi:unnamed protein product [Trypanosoma congolense IL3000]|uniref:WGS project CAEQ00000000 data, annotated contig 1259 n=1 Tax=Trypanosoma congolense (strain IL3000) TaxID=1068625 RepID=F9W504_TRYCI|nr:unnamed protein product [Trypanosoma congolense IL3000]
MRVRHRKGDVPGTAACSPGFLVRYLLLPLFLVSYATLQALAEEKVIIKLFESCSGCTVGQHDGPNGTGRLFKASGGFIKGKRFPILLCDIDGGGSTIRSVNTTGIDTIAGSKTVRGNQDGPAAAALFNNPTSVAGIGDDIFVADRDNKCIRRIDASGNVTIFGQVTLNQPTDIIVSPPTNATKNLFISDTGNSRIISVQILENNTVVSDLVTGFQPGVMQIGKKRNLMYTVKNTSWIAAVDLSSSGQRSWDIGKVECLYHSSSLMLTEDENELYYYGEKEEKQYIFSLKVDSEGPSTACATEVMQWNYGRIVSLVKVNAREFYAITETAVYIIRDKNYTPTPTPTPTQTQTPTPPPPPPPPKTPTPAPQPPKSTSKPRPSRTSAPPAPPPRPTAVAAFRASSLPTTEVEMMHMLYSWIMKDVALAFGTEDYFAVFLPPGENDVHGTTNVSTWTNLTALENFDKTILITNYYGPPGMSKNEIQTRLFASPWFWTRLFLDNISSQEDFGHLSPFCMVNCVEDCQYITFNETMCVNYTGQPACNDLCIGAIISSALLGIIFITLLWLMVASPANVKSAFVRLPTL